MKKTTISLLCLLLFTGLISAQNLPSYLPSNGLVGWWPFNGNANDQSGNNLSSTNSGISFISDRSGNANSAVSFAGNGSVKTPFSQQISPANFPNYSISLWFRRTFHNGGGHLIFQYKEGSLAPAGTSNFDFHESNSGFCGSNKPLIGHYPFPEFGCSPTIPSLGSWHHATLLFSQTTDSVQLYLNGNYWFSSAVNNDFPGQGHLIFGNNASDEFAFTGDLDDIAVYNRALSQQEILSIYQGGFTSNCLPTYMPTNGLLAYYPFCGNANDESGNSNNATNIQATPAADRFGNPGKAYDFNGANSRIICPVSNIPTGNSPSSISLWFKSRIFPFPADTSRAMLSWGSWANNSARYIGLRGATTNQLTYAQYLNDVNVPFNYQLNEWYHIVANYSNDTISIFVNGTKISSSAILGANTSAGPLIIGNSPGFTDHFNGLIDDAAVYNRALSQQEITALYQGGSVSTSCPVLPSNLQQGLKGYWPFCGNANDESGNGNNGSIYGATLTTDRFGNTNKAFSFVGNSRIKTPSSSTTLDIIGDITLSAWVKQSNDIVSSDLLPSQVFIWRGDFQGGFDPYGLMRYGTDFLIRRDVGPDSQTETVGFLKTIAPSDTWIQLTGTYNSSINKMAIYLNGKLMTSRTVNTPIQYPTSNFTTQFGGIEDYQGTIGLLDDIAIWNRALSPEEITQLYEIQSCGTPLTVNINASGTISANPGSGIQIQAQTNLDSTRWQWQAEAAEMGWNNLSNNARYHGIDSSMLRVTGIKISNHLQKFRVVGKSGACADTSVAVVLQVTDTCITSISDTSFVTFTDTSFITIYDTNTTTVYDTNLVTVTDTLIINTIITAGNPGVKNTLKAYPNPTAGMLYINTGNYAAMPGYSIRISSSSGQLVYESATNQALLEVPLENFGANGLYYLRLYNASGGLVTTRKIVLQQ